MLETGLCKESRCELSHPKICRNLFFRKYCPRGDTCWFVHPSKIENVLNNQNYPNNTNNRGQNQNINNNPRQNNQNQNQNMNFQNNYINGNGNRNFLETHHMAANNWSQVANRNQPMKQMMQSMLEKMNRMENKMLHLEVDRRIFNYQ